MLAKDSPYVDPDPKLAALLQAGQKAGQEFVVEAGKSGGGLVNGWTITQLDESRIDSIAELIESGTAVDCAKTETCFITSTIIGFRSKHVPRPMFKPGR